MKIINTNLTAWVLLPLLIAACGRQAHNLSEAPETVFKEETVVQAGEASHTAPNSVRGIARMRAVIERNAPASTEGTNPCYQSPECLNQQVDLLILAAANYYLAKYSSVEFGTFGAINSGSSSLGQVNRWNLVKSGSAFKIGGKLGKSLVQGLPRSGTALVMAGVVARGNGTYTAGGFVHLDVNRQLLAVAGADNAGYSVCYASPGFAPVCFSAGW